ncbi:MAG: 50S ribosomal protein L24 [Patescibacteria group bacterium]|nr:50S ribosomal protein L24 [Patescibacteria group bacterium]MDE1945830.1 50S ribosomal protein L24 [Patescibacteria group bacterium]
MKIKKGDNVIVIAGKDKGKSGKVLAAYPKKNLIVVDGVNKHKKHERRRTSSGKGQTIEKVMPIHVSNAMLVESGKRVRTGKKMISGKFVRASRKTGQEL